MGGRGSGGGKSSGGGGASSTPPRLVSVNDYYKEKYSQMNDLELNPKRKSKKHKKFLLMRKLVQW